MRILAILMFIPSIAIPSSDNLELNLGFSYPSLAAYKSDVSDGIEQKYNAYRSLLGPFAQISRKNSALPQAWNVQASYIRSLHETFGIGFEVGYENNFSNSYGISGSDPASSSTFRESIDESMDSYNAGLKIVLAAPTGTFRPELSIASGWFSSKLSSKYRGNITFLSPYSSTDYSGDPTYSNDILYAALTGSIGLEITPSVRIGLSAGYRFAKHPSITANENTDFDRDGDYEVKRGETYKDVNGSSLPFDLSGFQASLQMRYGW